MTHRRFVYPAAVIAAIALGAYAEKSTDYVPPSYLVRFGKSLVFLGITGLAIAAILFFTELWLADGGVDRTRRLLFWKLTGTLIVLAAMLAATDAMNDEGWNPAHTGSFVLTFLWPVAVLLLRQARMHAGVWIAALGLIPVFFILLRWLLFSIQAIGFDMSW